jgi:hypothetical protein
MRASMPDHSRSARAKEASFDGPRAAAVFSAMEEKNLSIDAAAVAREALQVRQPGEDIDEALLRACKKLYGESGMFAFQGIQGALGALAGRGNLDRESALKQMAGGQSGVQMRISTTIRTTEKTGAKSLDDLSPELRAKVEQAFAEGKGRVSVNSQTTATHRCGYCNFEFAADIATCPQCGRAVKTSFWSKLFGK